jgi:hypothetical protein
MSSGKTHDKVNSIVAISILGLGIATQTYELTLLSLGLAVGTIWAKFMGGSCADPKPFTINNPQ